MHKVTELQCARKLRKGDKVAIVSLSSGMLGEEFCSHNIEIGVRRLKDYGLEPVFMPNALKGIEYLKAHPKARAEDLKAAFLDDSITGIICAIGGDDTYRLLPYLMEDIEFISAVEKHPKLFAGFSDTTVNHLMFYKLGLSTYYGPNFICDLGEIADEMLPYTRKAFEGYLEGNGSGEIVSSDILIKVIDNEHLPIVYNVNFGHATPRCALQYGVVVKVDMKQKKIFLDK